MEFARVETLDDFSGLATLHSIVPDRDGHWIAEDYHLPFKYARGMARALTAKERAELNARADTVAPLGEGESVVAVDSRPAAAPLGRSRPGAGGRASRVRSTVS
jgi:hypothetical protein